MSTYQELASTQIPHDATSQHHNLKHGQNKIQKHISKRIKHNVSCINSLVQYKIHNVSLSACFFK